LADFGLGDHGLNMAVDGAGSNWVFSMSVLGASSGDRGLGIGDRGLKIV
jgi:hypothetical protein